MSVWIWPAACQAVRPRRRCQRLRGLRLAGGEERVQLEQLEGAAHDALEARLADAEIRAHRRRLLVVELRQLGLQPRGDGDHAGAVRGGVLGDRRGHLVARPRRRSRRTARAWRSAAGAGARRPAPPPGTGTVRAGRPGLQRRDDLAEPLLLGDRVLVAAARLAHDALVAALGLLEVGVDQLGLDRVDVAGGIDAALGVDDVRVAVRRARRGRARRSRGCSPGTGCPGPRPSTPRPPGRRCRGRRSCPRRSPRRRRSPRPARGARRRTGTTATFGSIVVNG